MKRLPRLAALCLTALAAACPAPAQEGPKAPVWSYAFDLSCRKFGELQFSKETKKWGFEVFKDANNGFGVYVGQTGDVGVVPQFDAAAPAEKGEAPAWTAGLDLKARKAGELEFTDKTKTYALEVFYDNTAKNWVYVTENGHLAVCPGKAPVAGGLKAPKWLHSFDLKCRQGGTREWADNTRTFGLEVYRDENNGNLIYLCETGSLAVVPAGPSAAGQGKDPEWLHGQDVQCRKFGEKDFTKDTRKYGLEIFRDANNGNLIFVCETGSLAVVPGGADLKAPTPGPKDAQFTHGLDLSCREAGEADFTSKTRTFAMEVFREGNVGSTLYVTEAGTIAAARDR